MTIIINIIIISYLVSWLCDEHSPLAETVFGVSVDDVNAQRFALLLRPLH